VKTLQSTSGELLLETEVDLVIETKGKLIPIEIKGSATPRPRNWASGILAFRNEFQNKGSRRLRDPFGKTLDCR